MEQMTAGEIRELMAKVQEQQREFERNAPIVALHKELARIEREKKSKVKLGR